MEKGAVGICPKCKQVSLEYNNHHIQDDYMYYNFTCKSCRLNGREYYELVFDGHTDNNGHAI